MNLIQLIRKARQGVDALLPGSGASAMWPDEEMVDLVNESMETVMRQFRLVHSKWNLVTLNTSSASFTLEQEIYAPSTSLVLTPSTTPRVTLPPDFAELVRVTCTSDRSIRFMPAQSETYSWIDTEMDSLDESLVPTGGSPRGLVFYYDLVGDRTLFITPSVTGTFNLEIDYVPMVRPLYYSNAGTVTVTLSSAAVTGSGTKWSTDGVYAGELRQRAELIVGAADVASNVVRVDYDYPAISSITSATALTLKAVYPRPTVSGSPGIVAMAPVLPREYHRHIARLASANMLAKINPELSDKYAARFMKDFVETIQPTSRRRQSQDSRTTEDTE